MFMYLTPHITEKHVCYYIYVFINAQAYFAHMLLAPYLS